MEAKQRTYILLSHVSTSSVHQNLPEICREYGFGPKHFKNWGTKQYCYKQFIQYIQSYDMPFDVRR